MVNQVLERILGCLFDGEEPNRGFMKKKCLLSNADRLRVDKETNRPFAQNWPKLVIRAPPGMTGVLVHRVSESSALSPLD